METVARFLIFGVIAAGVSITVWPKLRLWHRARKLHRQLARANGLDGEETAWLWRVAVAACPERPSLVFVRPSLIEVGPEAADADLAQVVYDKLFAS